MMTLFAETTLWQRNLASLIRSGLLTRAEVVGLKGLHAVVGVYGDGSHSAPLAKYADPAAPKPPSTWSTAWPSPQSRSRPTDRNGS